MCPSEMSFLIRGAQGLHSESLPLTSGWFSTPSASAQAESGAWMLYQGLSWGHGPGAWEALSTKSLLTFLLVFRLEGEAVS